MRLAREIRHLIGKAIDRGINKSWVSKVICVTRRTVYNWNKRRKHLNDKKRKAKKSKITLEVELSILALKNIFGWGCGRIQQGLFSLPSFMKDDLLKLGVKLVQNVRLFRTIINEVLTAHGINGYKQKHDSWQFFRAKNPNWL